MLGSSRGYYDTPKTTVASWERANRMVLRLRQFLWEIWLIFLDSDVHPRDALLPRPRLSLDVPELRPPCTSIIYLGPEINREFCCHDLLQHFQVKTNARSDQGTYYISARPGSLVLGGLKACQDTNWWSKYFFFRVDRHSIGNFDLARMTRTWSTNMGQMETWVSWFLYFLFLSNRWLLLLNVSIDTNVIFLLMVCSKNQGGYSLRDGTRAVNPSLTWSDRLCHF